MTTCRSSHPFSEAPPALATTRLDDHETPLETVERHARTAALHRTAIAVHGWLHRLGDRPHNARATQRLYALAELVVTALHRVETDHAVDPTGDAAVLLDAMHDLAHALDPPALADVVSVLASVHLIVLADRTDRPTPDLCDAIRTVIDKLPGSGAEGAAARIRRYSKRGW